ncbi:MAG: hypothetical protein JWN39_3888, partial [Ilumatobacteraceae bacterium]|nr:hypothetical protein [Ilumatobacteraceae bacterium]
SAQLAGGSCDARALDRVAARLAELGADDWALLDTGVGPFGDLSETAVWMESSGGDTGPGDAGE